MKKFTLRSGNKVSFKNMGSSPAKQSKPVQLPSPGSKDRTNDKGFKKTKDQRDPNKPIKLPTPAKQVATAPSKIPKETFKQGLEKGIGTKLDPWDKMESEVKTPEWMKEKTSDQIKAAKNQPEKVQSWKQSKAMSHKGKSKIKKETFKQGLKKGIGYGLKKVVGPAAIASTGYEIASLVGPMVGVEKGAGYKKFIKPIVDKMSKPKKLDTKAYSKSIEGKKAKQRGKAEAGKQKFIDPTN